MLRLACELPLVRMEVHVGAGFRGTSEGKVKGVRKPVNAPLEPVLGPSESSKVRRCAMKRKMLVFTLAAVATCLAVPNLVRAEDETSPGVARISLINGDVSTQRGDSGDWVATTVNAPIVSGDKVSTGANSRAEVQLDYANVLRMDQRTEAKIADLSRGRIQVQVASGQVNLTVFKGSDASVEIDTPNMAVHPLREGVYRILVNAPGDTSVTVRQGAAQVSTPQGSTTVESNRTIYVRGTDNPEYQIAKAVPKDGWDDWNRDRDNQILNAKSWQYTNRYYTGSDDLDRYGHWVYVPDYDWCWVPYVNAGWVPYADGRWVWEPYWGWTWVSYEPWGWAPYHYGRWFWSGNSWCWWPGFRGHRGYWGGFYPTWAPAYVSFLGFGYGSYNWGFGIGFGFGSIGWCPLGPYDRVSPWWGYHNRYNVINITNITNITNINNINNMSNIHSRAYGANRSGVYGSNLVGALNNANIRRAITTVPTQDFVNGRVSRSAAAIDPGMLKQAQVVQGTLPAVPTRQSLSPTNRQVRSGAIPTQAANNQRFFSTRSVPAGPMSFNERQAQLQQMVRQNNPQGATNASGQANPGVAAGRPGAAQTSGAAGQPFPSRGIKGQAAQAGAGNSRFSQPGFRGIQRGGTGQSSTATGMPMGEVGQRSVGPGQQIDASKVPPATPMPPGTKPVTVPQPRGRSTPGVYAPQPGSGSATTSPNWQRFGAPNQAGGALQNRTTTVPGRAAAPQSMNSASPSAARPNWQQPGTNATRERWPAAVNMPGSAGGSASPQTFQSRPSTPSATGNQGGWSHFSSQPRSASPQTSPRTWTPRSMAAEPNRGFSAPQSTGSSGGWSRFSPREQTAPANRGGSWSSPAPQSRREFNRTWQGQSYQQAAPRSYARQPLELRKPIVTERSYTPRSSGGWSAPSWGGGRGYSAPSGGGGRSYSGGGGHGGSSGHGRR
jgi:hypothetical protein